MREGRPWAGEEQSMAVQGAQVIRMKQTEPTSSSIELVADQRLLVRRGPEGDLLTLVGADGGITLTIRVTPDGPVAELRGGAVGLRVDGSLAIEAERLALRGREEVIISSDGGIRMDAGGDLLSEARGHRIDARLGNVDIRANDDVTLDGERVKMNC